MPTLPGKPSRTLNRPCCCGCAARGATAHGRFGLNPMSSWRSWPRWCRNRASTCSCIMECSRHTPMGARTPCGGRTKARWLRLRPPLLPKLPVPPPERWARPGRSPNRRLVSRLRRGRRPHLPGTYGPSIMRGLLCWNERSPLTFWLVPTVAGACGSSQPSRTGPSLRRFCDTWSCQSIPRPQPRHDGRRGFLASRPPPSGFPTERVGGAAPGAGYDDAAASRRHRRRPGAGSRGLTGGLSAPYTGQAAVFPRMQLRPINSLLSITPFVRTTRARVAQQMGEILHSLRAAQATNSARIDDRPILAFLAKDMLARVGETHGTFCIGSRLHRADVLTGLRRRLFLHS